MLVAMLHFSAALLENARSFAISAIRFASEKSIPGW
jgi:hypothetical protein